MSLQLFNTLSGEKEDFKPIRNGKVGMYNCGPTVYNYAHIGNLRAYVFADLLRRALEYSGYKVKQVINITDVGHLTGDNLGDADTGEDKMEKGATRENKKASEIAEFYTRAFLKDLALLNIETKSTKFPRATGYIKEQIELIEKLEKKGFTYKTSDGIYFNTNKFESYGKLGNIDIKGLKEGARVETNTEKKNSTDFALWKFSPRLSSGQAPRQQEWKSPWGVGFPGWHIECSAMSMKYLGETFDIHTGGIDHIPTHHNNEIAQSEAATSKKFVNYWLHNEFVNASGEKMAKSSGDFLRLKSIIDHGIFPLAYRYWLLGAHYRTQMNFTWEALNSAYKAYERLLEAFSALKGSWYSRVDSSYKERFEKAIDDDLNTPQALALVWDLLKDEKIKPADKKKTLEKFDEVLGLNLKKESKKIKKVTEIKIPKEVAELVAARAVARASKDFAKADELRRRIEKLGFSIKDTESGADLKPL